jgi:hypothetical protein
VDKDVLIQKAISGPEKKRSATVHKEMNEFFRAMIPVIENKATAKVNGNSTTDCLLKQVGQILEPDVILFKDDDSQLLSKYLVDNLEYSIVHVDALMTKLAASDSE